MERNVLQFSDYGEIAFAEERMKVFEDENGRLNHLDDLIESRQRVARRAIARFLRLNRRPARNDSCRAAPLKKLLLPLPGDFLHHSLCPQLFVRKNVDNRVPRPDQAFEL